MRQQLTSAFSRLTLSILLFSILTSCGTFASSPTPSLPPTSTPPPAATMTPLPSPTVPPTPIPAPVRATYTLNTSVDYDAHTVSVEETIEYPNHTGVPLTSLVLAVVPNLWADSFALASISVDDAAITNYSLNGQRLDVPLPAALAPEKIVVLSIQYKLALPFAEQADPNISRPRIYGYTSVQTNLTNWYPFVVPYINGDWVLHDPWYYGEHLVYDTADFDVTLQFANPANAPVVASSGAPEPNGDATRYTLTAGRAFVFSMSRDFQIASMQVADVLVSSYYFPLSKVAGRALLQITADAIQVFSQRFGAYPHKTLSIVMADFKDSMEYSAFYYQSPLYYDQYDGTSLNYLTYIGAHETAHQWWFEQVANDQAQQPWLDESMATYSEHIYYESLHPDLVANWWIYRVDFFQPHGFIDIPVHDGKGFETYRITVYLQGAHFLEDLRARIGDEIFFAFIKDYLTQENGKIATSEDFFRILREHTKTDFSDLVRLYFQNVY
jgi:hypothetical protein